MERRFRSLQTQYQETFMEIDMMKLEAKRCREQVRTSQEYLNDVRAEHSEVQLRLNRVKVCIFNIIRKMIPFKRGLRALQLIVEIEEDK